MGQRDISAGTDLKRTVLVVAGPTASGKSALALAVAEEFGRTVINADSMQVYRELRILTNRPLPEHEARAPHRLFGVLCAAEKCSAARWRALALAEIADAHEGSLGPIVVGGTGLYLKALIDGLSPIPDIPLELRSHLRLRLTEGGSAALHEELSRRDQTAAERFQPGDSQRVLRALEVLETTGRSITEFQESFKAAPPPGLRFVTILLQPQREPLYAKCDSRLVSMIEAGVIDEVRDLRNAGLDLNLPIMKALGVTEFGTYLDGQKSLEQALQDAQQATRRYAKRQTTWFGTQIIADFIIVTQYSERIRDEIFAFIRQKVLTAVE
jgi:tRNA dimethylallyltransferase